MPNETDDFLAHYGVLGMHWGRHLPGRSEKSHNPRPQKYVHPDHLKARELRKKGISGMSTQELREVTSRLQAEQSYKNLTPSKVKRGNNAVKGIIAAAGTATALAALYGKRKAVIDVGKAIISPMIKGDGKHILSSVAVNTAKHLA